jgi:hypothetical protein
MYLAGILGLCALLHVPASGHVGGGPSPLVIADATTIRMAGNQEPAKPEAPPAEPITEDQTKPEKPVAPETQTPGTKSEQEKSNPPASTSGQKEQNPTPAGTAAKKPATHKKHSASQASQGSNKKVVRHGSAVEPITQLTPGMPEEQAARQRAVTNQLLASTDTSLQKLSGRTLTKEQQDTVVQIRKFQEQVKQADSAGDLQRAYKLAVKAHLLSDALTKP